MNPWVKKGRNHEYQMTNDFASIPDSDNGNVTGRGQLP